MDIYQISAEVERHMSAKRKKAFSELYSTVLKVCTQVKSDLGVNVVRDVYGRDDKQGEVYKTNAKIAKKIAIKRKEGRQEYSVKDVKDIVGLTAVLQYPDQVDTFINEIEKRLASHDISVGGKEKVRKPGYYATHVDLVSAVPPHAGLYCELQVKTMLHDAWAAKMHDLNYKPNGEIDPRLDSMMRVIADTIESIEVQSQTLRELITERWHAESLWRKAARLRMFETMPAWVTGREMMDPAAIAILEEMVQKKSDISVAAKDSAYIRALEKRISSVGKKSSRDVWVLFSYLASLTGHQANVDYALQLIDDWVSEVEGTDMNGENLLQSNVHSIPLACSAVGDLDRAIDLSRHILKQFSTLSDHTVRVLKWNLANFLTEKHYFVPEDPETKKQISDEIASLVADCGELRALDESMFHDLEGMMIVSFSNNAREIREAIKLIERGLSEAPSDEEKIAEAFFELHSRMAWRRLLEVEAGST